jgi:hypothetical protein
MRRPPEPGRIYSAEPAQQKKDERGGTPRLR